MLLKKYKKKGYTSCELRRGVDGLGKALFLVQTERPGIKRKHIYYQEAFKTRKEAERWIKTI